MGFKDGTRNVTAPVDLDDFVWCDDDVDWMQGGTYQVARKIAMDIEVWDTTTIGAQHQTFGRDKAEGAPLSGSAEHDTPDFAATDADGAPGDPGDLARGTGLAGEQRRRQDPAPGLQLHRRPQRLRTARRRPDVPGTRRTPTSSSDCSGDWAATCSTRTHHPHRVRAVRGAARPGRGPLHR